MTKHFKVLQGFNISTNDIPQSGEERFFTIDGELGAVFSLVVKNEDNKYYNFVTRLFQTEESSLKNAELTSTVYTGGINFPAVTSADTYEFSLRVDYASTRHARHVEARRGDGSYDTNLSTGSNSALLKRIIYQTLDKTITITSYSPLGMTGSSVSTQVIKIPRSQLLLKIPFSITATAATTRAFQILKTPSNVDTTAYVSRAIGSAPVSIIGEDIYPVITTAANSTSEGGTTVNGASTGTTVTTHVVSSTIATLHDRVLGNAALAATNVTVTAISSGSGKTFTISEAISIADDLPLSFSNQRNHSWPINSTTGIIKGMRVVSDAGSNGFASGTIVSDYKEIVTSNEGTADEVKRVVRRKAAKENSGKKPTITTDGTTNITTITQPGDITFNNQALRTFGGETVKIYSYGVDMIKKTTGYDFSLTNMKVVLTPVTTTTTAASAGGSSTSVVVASRNGILDDVSTVSGIGIDSSVVNPTVDTGAGAVENAGTIVLTAAQSLESGVTLTFANAGTIATITGNITIHEVGNEDITIRLDLDKFLSYT